MLLIMALPMLQQGGSGGPSTSPAPSGEGAAGPAGTPPDITSMTPAERAVRLFNRVMEASEAGDEAQVQQFLPMAIAAHDMARPLDLDQLYHLARLHQAGRDHNAALTVAREALEEDPNDLLALMVGGESAAAVGDSAVSRQFATRFLEAFDSERAKSADRYTQHAVQLDSYRVTARRVTGGR